MRFLRKTKYRISLLVVMIMFLQIFMPAVGRVVFADETSSESIEQLIRDEQDISGESTGVEVTGENTPKEDDTSKDTTNDKVDSKEVDSKEENILSESTPVNDFRFITGVEITDENGKPFEGKVASDSKIRIKYKYELKDNVKVDTNQKYSLKIPEEISILRDMQIELKRDSDVIAIVNIDTNNNVTIQFNENVNDEDFMYGRTGYFYVYSEFASSKLGNGGQTEIVFDLGGGHEKTIIVDFEKSEKTSNVSLYKSGEYDNDKNEITWNIKVNAETMPSGGSIKDLVISDVIQKGQKYIGGSAKISPDASGGFTFENDVLNYRFNGLVKDGDFYNIEFKTKPDLSSFDSEGKEIYFKNQAEATFNEDGKSISNEGKVSTKVDFVRKNGEYNYDTHQIDWTIEINNNNLEIRDAEIIDTIPKGLELVKDSVKLNGQSVNYDYPSGEDGSNILKYKFDEMISKKHTLTYSTKVVDPDAYKSNTPKTYNNHVKLEGYDVPVDAYDEIGVGVPTYVIEKWGGGYNTSTQEITWNVRVNYNKIKIDNAIFEDKIPDGLKYVEGSFKMNKEGSPETDGSSSGEFKYEGGIISYTFNSQINEPYILTFKTKVLDKNLWANNDYKYFNNTAVLKGNNIPESSSTGNEIVSSEVIRKTGTGYDYLTREASWKIVINQNKMPINNAKVEDIIGQYQDFVEESVIITGSNKDSAKINFDKDTRSLTVEFPGEIKGEQIIEFKTKVVDDSIFHTNGEKYLENTATLKGDQIPEEGVSSQDTNEVENTVVRKTGKYTNGNNYINWEVVINQNQLPISNAVLEDTLQEGLELDTSSVKLIKLMVDKEGHYKEVKEVALDASNISYNYETRKFEFHFNEKINEAYLLKFKTDIDDAYNDATFTNTINFKGSSRAVEDTAEDIRVAFQTAGGGAGGSSRGSIKVVKVDEKNNSQKLDGAVFELLDAYGNVLKTSEPTGDNGETLFKGLKYDTMYSIREKEAPKGYTLSNEVYKFQVKDEDDKKNISYSFKNSKIKGNIEFKKYDETNNPLEGAEFTLYNTGDDKFEKPIATALSGKDGKVRFENIEFGKYNIKETKAPDGYLLSNEVLEATISESGETVKTNPDSISNTIIKGNLKLLKVIKGTKTPLKDAKITVYKEDGTLVGEQVTDDDGFAKFENLHYGRYYYIETKAPSGYYRDNEKHYFNIDKDGVTVEDILENTKIPQTIPWEPTEPGKPNKPNEPEVPKDPVNPNDPNNSTSGLNGDKDGKDNQTIGFDNNTPKDDTKADKNGILPRTGETNNVVFYLIGLMLISSGYFFIRKKS